MPDITYYLDQPYTKVLRRDDEGDVIATIAEFDGCMAHGSDDSEALRNLREAQADWIEAALAAGQDIPVPEVEGDLPSGKFVVRVPRSLHQKLNKLAKKDDVSLNQLVVMAAAEHVARRESRGEMMRAAIDAWRGPAPVKWKRSDDASAAKTGEYLEQLKEHGAVAAEDRHPSIAQRRGRRG